MIGMLNRQWWESATGLKGRGLWFGVAGAVGMVVVGIALFIGGYYG